ncbi:MAG: ABC transporter ATP-binding protein, partial [Chloroflexi bacterium]|nr:ABC transporter ATP-binding protein [Chloroflexota bacterium]
MTDAAVSVNGVSYAYGDLLAVDNISFQVGPGEVLGVLGPNGAGKSTAIRMLTGQARPKAGSITVLGIDVTKHSTEVQSRIGVCFEEKNLYLNMSGKENLEFFARLFGIKGFDAMQLLEKVDLADRAKDRAGNYSRGMRQRLMVARTLVNTPDVLFLDEPTSGLDPVSSQAIRQIVREEASRGAAVILTTHDMHEADELSNRVAFINEGRIAALDTPENLKLAHGRRSVRIRVREDGQVRD